MTHWPIRFALIALIALPLLTACGQKGPLTLPDEADAAAQPAGSTQATEEATRDEDQD